MNVEEHWKCSWQALCAEMLGKSCKNTFGENHDSCLQNVSWVETIIEAFFVVDITTAFKSFQAF